MTHIIVTGSRDLTTDEDYLYMERVLSCGKADILSITQGAAKGADAHAKAWASFNNKDHHDFPADWRSHGKSAGPIRNRHMVDETIKRFGKDNVIVLAFTNKPLVESRGTNHCVDYAISRGLTVHHFRTDLKKMEF